MRNAADTIGVTLESVRAQSHPDVEHVIIDGASTDDTARVVAAEGRHIATFLSEPDRGVYDAFNKGIARCTGEVIGFLNAGDVYSHPDVLARVAAEFVRTAPGAVFADVEIVDARDTTRVVRRYSSARFEPGAIRGGFMPAHPTLFVRRDVYERLGPYDASYRIGGDFEMVARLFGRHRVSYSYIPEVLVRMPRGGLSNSGWRSMRIITREMYRACETHGIRTSRLRLWMRLPMKLFELRIPRFR